MKDSAIEFSAAQAHVCKHSVIICDLASSKSVRPFCKDAAPSGYHQLDVAAQALYASKMQIMVRQVGSFIESWMPRFDESLLKNWPRLTQAIKERSNRSPLLL